jgi:hypothetical protein
MFASLVMATRGRPFAVWLGATAAFAVHVVTATTVGVLLIDILPHRAVEVAVALTFFAGAGFALYDGASRSPRPGPAPVVNRNVFRVITAIVLIILDCYAGWAALS